MPLRAYLAESMPLEHGIATTDKNEQYCVSLHHGCSWFVKIYPGDNRESRHTRTQLGKPVLQFWTHSYILTASYLPWFRISIYGRYLILPADTFSHRRPESCPRELVKSSLIDPHLRPALFVSPLYSPPDVVIKALCPRCSTATCVW